MRVLVTGAAGLLGSHVAAALQAGEQVLGIDRHPWWGDRPLTFARAELDDAVTIEETVRVFDPDLVVHCAALVDVDACERMPERAFSVNAVLPGRLARAVRSDCLFVYITTDGVFRGDAPNATETMRPEPRTVYGQSKLGGEREVAAATANHLILRTNFFGWSSGRKSTFAEWLYGALERQQPITLFDDFHFSPIYVVQFAAAMLRLIEAGERGLFHLTGGERISKYAFGLELARQAGFDTAPVTRGSLDAAALAAPRPKDMSLDTRRAAAVLGEPLPGAADSIARFLADRGRTLSERAAEATRRVRA